MGASSIRVKCVEGENPIVRFSNGLALYEEGFTDGRWLVRNWSAIGIVDYDPITIGAAHLNAAFGLELDGESLHHGWAWGGMEEGAEARPGQRHVAVTLKHQVRPVTLRLHTVLDGTPVLTRWLEIINTGERPAALGALWVWSGQVFPIQVGDHKTVAPPRFVTAHGPYSLGYFAQNHPGMEGDFQWRQLGPEIVQIGQDLGTSGWGHPLAYLRDEASGQMFIVQLAWSGNWAIRVIPRRAAGRGSRNCLCRRVRSRPVRCACLIRAKASLRRPSISAA